jgi:hypothetical protein
MYPDELDVLYGNAILFKVMNKSSDVPNEPEFLEVVDMLTDSLILEKFFECYMPKYGVLDFAYGKVSPIRVCDEFSSFEFENSSGNSPCVESKRKAKDIYDSTGDVDAKKFTKQSKIV